MEFDSKLFFGFLVDPSFQAKIDGNLKKIFVNDESSYLQEFFFDECLFFGKFLNKSCHLKELELLSLNILSLLQKLVPEHKIDASDLVLIPIKC